MESPSVEVFCNYIIQSRLLDSEVAQKAWQRWQQERAGRPGDAVALGQWLVAQHYLTRYQADLLLRGRWDRHFLHDYKILSRIGQGRMAGVYRAIHRLGQTVAIKVLPPSRVKDPEAFGRFQREARLALRLRHANIVRTFQVAEDRGLHYLVMEYLEGETLEEVLQQRGKLTPPEAVFLIYQALQGLEYLHEQGIVHRDLKPANLMLVPAGPAPPHQAPLQTEVKILDIGLGRALFDEEGTADGGVVDLTTSGTLLGDPNYMAPEQARDAHSADVRSDIYSLGCVLYHALAGQPPFADRNAVRTMVRHASEQARRIAEINPEAPDGLQKILDWMMAKDPAQRYPTPDRAAKALELYLTSQVTHKQEQATPYFKWLEEQEPPSAASSLPERPAVAQPTLPVFPASGQNVRPVPAQVPPGAPPPRAAVPPPRKQQPAASEGTPPGTSTGPPSPIHEIGRRDFLFLLLGVGGAVLAVLLGFLLVRWLRPRSVSKDQ